MIDVRCLINWPLVFFLLVTPALGCDDTILNSFVSSPNHSTYGPLARQLEGDISFIRGIENTVDSSKPAFYGYVYKAFLENRQNGCFYDLIELINTGNGLSIEIGALLYQLADGGVAEDLAAALGMAIGKQPALILSLLKKHKLFEPSKRVFIAGMLPVDVYTDKYAERIDELLRRKKAILSVNDPKLDQVKKACLKTIDDDINLLTKSLNTTR